MTSGRPWSCAISWPPLFSASSLALDCSFRTMDSIELTWLPAWKIRQLIAGREVSPVEVAEHFLGRAEALDAVFKIYRTLDVVGLRERAKWAEKAVLDGAELGSLHGVPIAVKEHIAVEGLPVRPIAFASEGPVRVRTAARDATLVARLRAAGANIFGTTIMPGMGSIDLLDANGERTTDLSFHPRNPWELGRVTGSSSSGSCAAVAGGVLPVAIGSDGGGSTRLPSAWCGLLGLHPTMGRVPVGGLPERVW